LAQLIEFAQQRPSFHRAAGSACEAVEAFLQQKGKERAEHMAPDRRVCSDNNLRQSLGAAFGSAPLKQQNPDPRYNQGHAGPALKLLQRG
jgi:hypothetical protein